MVWSHVQECGNCKRNMVTHQHHNDLPSCSRWPRCVQMLVGLLSLDLASFGYIPAAVPTVCTIGKLALSDFNALAGTAARGRMVYTAKAAGMEEPVVVKIGSQEQIIAEVGCCCHLLCPTNCCVNTYPLILAKVNKHCSTSLILYLGVKRYYQSPVTAAAGLEALDPASGG